MKATQIILSVACAAGLPACALQGEQSFTPTGVTLNHSTRIGTDAFAPNPLKQQPVIHNEAPVQESYVTNNYYTETRYVHAPDPHIVVVPQY